MPSAPPDAAVARFSDDLSALIGGLPGTLGLAVSGGPDSLALLLLSHAAGFGCKAATVDHGLRTGSDSEATFVEGICVALGVPHATLKLGLPSKGNVSDWARHARYDALAHWAKRAGCDHLLTAHHADDQLETMIMRLNRGSGVAGLSGIRVKRGQVVRPLLGWRKAELESLVDGCGLVACDDPTNRDDRFDRARLRKALAGADWLNPVAASQSAAALAEAEAALDWTAKTYAEGRISAQNDVTSFDPSALPRELVRRITLMCLRQISHDASPRGDELDQLISGLSAGRTLSLAGVKCAGGDIWRFSAAPARRGK